MLGVLLIGASPVTSDIEAAQAVVVKSMTTGKGAGYFSHYCVAVNTGTLPPSATLKDYLRATSRDPDPSPDALARFQQVSRRIVAASECDATGDAAYHR